MKSYGRFPSEIILLKGFRSTPPTTNDTKNFCSLKSSPLVFSPCAMRCVRFSITPTRRGWFPKEGDARQDASRRLQAPHPPWRPIPKRWRYRFGPQRQRRNFCNFEIAYKPNSKIANRYSSFFLYREKRKRKKNSFERKGVSTSAEVDEGLRPFKPCDLLKKVDQNFCK